MPASYVISQSPRDLEGVEGLLVIGRAARLCEPDVIALVSPSVQEGVWRQMVRGTDGGDHGRLSTTWTAGPVSRVHVGVLPEPCSRHSSPSRAWAIPALVASVSHKGPLGIVLCLDEPGHAASALLAVARSLPTYQAGGPTRDREVRVLPLARADAPGALPDMGRVGHAIHGVRRAAHETDEPPDVLNCTAFVTRARDVAAEVGASAMVIRGEELRTGGFGGLWGVGKAAAEPPALVVLTHAPASAKQTVAWVGKGIVFDTGGLSIKAKTSMPGMKTDMAGAAAVLAAFAAAVRMGFSERLHAVLCIAENAVGPGSLRPDDIIVPYSGRTVEVNNTDAEGRLVLADGLAWVARHAAADRIVDLATLTGAQSIATGKRHAAIVSNDAAFEARMVEAGLRSGDMVFPLPYLPEFLRSEFRSPVADMRNSVKDRNNAQPSAAGQFLANHLIASGYEGPWVHVDMAAPAVSGSGRGTGYGVALLLASEGLI